MKLYKSSYRGLVLLLLAIIIGAGSLIYTNNLVNILQVEERNKVELWAKATRMIVSAETEQDLDLLLSIIENNNTVPVILTDGEDNIITSVNFDSVKLVNPLYLPEQLQKIKEREEPIVIDLGDGFTNHIYYKDSIILTLLMYFPYIQLIIITTFIIIAYLGFNSTKKAEENQVWTSMSKETAHQLGTPTSSLAGWVEVLEEKYPDVTITNEIKLDVERLEKITCRFSSIGTRPSLKEINITEAITKTIKYLKTRVSSKVNFNINFDVDSKVIAKADSALLEWVIENISKNAVDAMEGKGDINYHLIQTPEQVIIDISDTGKGLSHNTYKKIFKAGFTTKKHGWGLGLSLAKRIIEEFHKGKLFVKESEIGKGTTFRILLNN